MRIGVVDIVPVFGVQIAGRARYLGVLLGPGAQAGCWREAARKYWWRLCETCLEQTGSVDRVRRKVRRVFQVALAHSSLRPGKGIVGPWRVGLFVGLVGGPWQAIPLPSLPRVDLLRLRAIPALDAARLSNGARLTVTTLAVWEALERGQWPLEADNFLLAPRRRVSTHTLCVCVCGIGSATCVGAKASPCRAEPLDWSDILFVRMRCIFPALPASLPDQVVKGFRESAPCCAGPVLRTLRDIV